jgi:hypothetical protein
MPSCPTLAPTRSARTGPKCASCGEPCTHSGAARRGRCHPDARRLGRRGIACISARARQNCLPIVPSAVGSNRLRFREGQDAILSYARSHKGCTWRALYLLRCCRARSLLSRCPQFTTRCIAKALAPGRTACLPVRGLWARAGSASGWDKMSSCPTVVPPTTARGGLAR